MSPSFDNIKTEKCWRVRVYRNGRSVSLGNHSTQEKAKEVELAKKRELDRLEEIKEERKNECRE